MTPDADLAEGELQDEQRRERTPLDEFFVEFDVPTSAPLMKRAFIHRSYAAENELTEDNERLEFLGDSVIGWIVSELLFDGHPDKGEGFLTRRRAALVNRRQLGQVGITIGLGTRLKLGRGESMTGGRERATVVGNCLEAIVGALFRECGVATAREFVRRFIVEDQHEVAEQTPHWQAKSLLQEWTQQNLKTTPTYRLIEQTGPDHEPSFRAAVDLGERQVSEGMGPRVKDAENAAAAAALDLLKAEHAASE